jgi:crotonobetaine/carnitine-CoA ligase
MLDPRMPRIDECVLRPMLERRAAETPDKVFAVFADGTSWTYRRMRDEAVSTAHALRRLGVRQGDHVLSWLPNGHDVLRVWFGLNYLGAVYVPINLAYRGALLEHVLRVSDAKLIVLHAQLLERLGEIDRSHLETAVVLAGTPGISIPGLTIRPADALAGEEQRPPALDRDIMPHDAQSMIYTSGTTGPSKGVLSSYMHLYAMATGSDFLRGDDRFLINLPCFHVGGTFPIYAMLIHGASIAMAERFETAAFWQTVRTQRITACIVLGSMAGFLLNRPPSSDDRTHPLRLVVMVPYGEPSFEFAERFGCDVYTHFNMTEISMPLVTGPNPNIPGVAGRPRPGVQLRVVDENDCEVPVGTVGELIIRTDCPWAMNHGYAHAPEATARAWRNGWFHTGDAAKLDEHGNYYFVDRIKDAIRRRGENISSFEVETELCAHPAVSEAAAVAYPSEHGEDEVLAVLTLNNDVAFDHEELIAFLTPRMPHYMVPRFIWIVPELPRTPTMKVQKEVLRKQAASAKLWDRQANGIVLKAEKLDLEPAAGQTR